MRTIRIYQPGHYEPGNTIELTASASQHIGVVLRMQPGEQLTLFCGDNREFSATIDAVRKKTVVVRISAVIDVNRESSCVLHLAQAISKGDAVSVLAGVGADVVAGGGAYISLKFQVSGSVRIKCTEGERTLIKGMVIL